jgi:hypothetical protein
MDWQSKALYKHGQKGRVHHNHEFPEEVKLSLNKEPKKHVSGIYGS